MVGTSVWDYVFIRGCIFVLHLIAPLSIIYSAASLCIHLPFRLPRLLEAWVAFEAMFYLFFYIPRKAYLQNPTSHPTTVCREDRRKLFQRCQENIPDPNQYLAKWFLDAPTAEIKRENVKDFFRWAFLNTADSDPAYDMELEEYVGDMEKMLGRKLEPGRGRAKCLRLSIDKVDMLHRSLIWYFVSSYVSRGMSLSSLVSNDTTIVRVCCRHFNLDLYALSLLRLLPGVVPPFPLRLSIPTSYFIYYPLLCCKKPYLLAPASYLED